MSYDEELLYGMYEPLKLLLTCDLSLNSIIFAFYCSFNTCIRKIILYTFIIHLKQVIIVESNSTNNNSKIKDYYYFFVAKLSHPIT